MGQQTRQIKVRDLLIGGGAPISVQSMCATHTQDIDVSLKQIESLWKKGADLIRLAADSPKDVGALKEIRRSTKARLVVDLQENFLLADKIASYVDKIRYNPGHLYHLEKSRSIEDKVAWLVSVAKDHGIALRIGVNCGSIAPDFIEKYKEDKIKAIVENALWHCGLLERSHFENYVVSLKDSDPEKVVLCNKEFSKRRPEVPLHLGVTEAGLLEDGVMRTRMAFEKLIPLGIGDTVRVSLTVPNDEKCEEIAWGRKIIEDIRNGVFMSVPDFDKGLKIISCPSCSRVENGDFVRLATEIKSLTSYAKDQRLTIAVMGCRVNGPGETDDADLGLWCGPNTVTLKHKSQVIGAFKYLEILPIFQKEFDRLLKK